MTDLALSPRPQTTWLQPFRSILDTRWLPLVFLICAIPTGLRLALLTPMSQVADEPAHIARTDGLLYGQIFGYRIHLTNPVTHFVFPISGVTANDAIIGASVAELRRGPVRKLSAKRIEAAQAIPWSNHNSFDVAPNTVQYFPFFYIPGTLGIAFAHAIGQSPINALFAGRIGMLISFLAMGFAALAIATWGRGLIFALLTLPLTISLGASFNQDGQLLAATALACALLMRHPLTKRRYRVFGAALFTLVIGSKAPYGLLLFAALIPLGAPDLAKRFLRLSLFAIGPIVWVALMTHLSMVTFHWPAYHPGPLWPGSRAIVLHGTNPADNLRVLLARPAEFILLPVQLLAADWHIFALTAVGVLGWLSIFLHQWQYDGWFIALGCAAIGGLGAPADWVTTWRDSAWVIGLIVLSIFAVELAQYLSWTLVGTAVINGVTGRYFLPFLPFLALAIPRKGIAIDRAIGIAGSGKMLEMAFALPAVTMAVLDVYYLPEIFVRIFYQ